MKGAKPYDNRAMRRVFGILLALLAVPLTVVWFSVLFAAVRRHCGFIFTCADYWRFTAVSGIIMFGMWAGSFALLSAEENRRRAFGFLIGAILLALIMGLIID